MKKTYSDRLFIVNQRTQTLEINKDEVREIKEFKVILERDRGGKVPGDSQGRKKEFARKELYYVYIMADPFSMFSVLNETRKHQRALEETGLIRIEGWKPDKAIKDAIEAYKKGLRITSTGYAFINSAKALHNLGEDIKLLNEYSDDLREKISEQKELLKDEEALGEDLESAKAKLQGYLKNLSSNNREILTLTSTLPDRMEALEKLKTKLSEEDSEMDEVIGGGRTYNREDPT